MATPYLRCQTCKALVPAGAAQCPSCRGTEFAALDTAAARSLGYEPSPGAMGYTPAAAATVADGTGGVPPDKGPGQPPVPPPGEGHGEGQGEGPAGGRNLLVLAVLAIAVVGALIMAIGAYLMRQPAPPGTTNTPAASVTATGTITPTATATTMPTATSTATPVTPTATPQSLPTDTSQPAPTETLLPPPTGTGSRSPAPTATAVREPTATSTGSLTPAPVITRTGDVDGAEYVYVEAGEFNMGSDPKADTRAQANEQPQHTVTLPGFWIMRTEVTNGQYKRCVDDNHCKEPANRRWNDPAYAEYPVTHVTWQMANEYAAWAGGRLPTEAEWEKACRGTEKRLYPWGASAPTAKLANYLRNAGDTTPVGKYSRQGGDSPYGLADMAGNVWEWTSSQYQSYPYDAADGRENPDADAVHTLRGGSWYYGDNFMRCAHRSAPRQDRPSFDVGFRVLSAGR